MQESIKAAKNKAGSSEYGPAALFGKEQAEAVQKYHAGFPAYHATDLKKWIIWQNIWAWDRFM